MAKKMIQNAPTMLERQVQQYLPHLVDTFGIELKLLNIRPRSTFKLDRGQIIGLEVRDNIIPLVLLEVKNLKKLDFHNFSFDETIANLLQHQEIDEMTLINPKGIECLSTLSVKYLHVLFTREITMEEELAILSMIEYALDYKIQINAYNPKLETYKDHTHLTECTPRWGEPAYFYTRELMNLEHSCGLSLNNEPKFGVAGVGSTKVHIGRYGRYMRSASDFPKSNPIDKIGIPGANLDEFPEILMKYPDLYYLDLSKNNFKEIPEQIFEFKKLQYLYISSNKITKFDRRLLELPLTTLVISNNKLRNLPGYMGEIPTLRYLDISHNKLTQLPKQFLVNTKVNYLYLEGQPIKPSYTEIEQIKKKRNYHSIWRIDIDNPANLGSIDGGIIINPSN
ncbi:MAG: leucine-rich repeat domain-containing protein [Candidatus Heimdallarchaeota archaeon]|nr:leucine-rich repeat domain-containing protein [Candidatus Heimdallarchaeota archaeon]